MLVLRGEYCDKILRGYRRHRRHNEALGNGLGRSKDLEEHGAVYCNLPFYWAWDLKHP